MLLCLINYIYPLLLQTWCWIVSFREENSNQNPYLAGLNNPAVAGLLSPIWTNN